MQNCTRYPCDNAYRRSPHQGPHTVSRGESIDYDAARDEWHTRWSVSNVATGDEPWLVRLRVGNCYIELNHREVLEFSEAVLKASHGMMIARLEDETVRREHAEAAAELHLDDGRHGTYVAAEATPKRTGTTGEMR